MDMRVVKATKYRKIFVGSHKRGLDAILPKNGGNCPLEMLLGIYGKYLRPAFR